MRLFAPPQAAAALFLGLHVLAATCFDPATDSRCRERGICLSSFIWCSADNSGDCTYPSNGGAIYDGSDFGILYEREEYEIAWRQEENEFPVLIEWSSQPRRSGEQSGSSIRHIIWSTNVTADAPFAFCARDIFDELPTAQTSNFTKEEVILGAQNVHNTIRISQPGSNESFVSSSQFVILPDWSQRQVENLEEKHREAEQRWRIGVGVGVGLGVPILMAITWVVAKRTRHQRLGSLEKGG